MKYLLSIFILLFFIACDDTTSTNISTNSNTKIAYLYDTAVNGVQYKCGNITGITGDTKTKEAGSFYYQDNCEVKFTLGKIYLGSVAAKNIREHAKVYPTNLVGVNTTDSNNIKAVNILRFLQTLDDDNNTLNGITISSNARDNLNLSSTNTLDLTRTDLNDTIIQEAINDANTSKTLITKVRAIAHFEQTLRLSYPNIDTVAPAKPFVINPITKELVKSKFYINNVVTKIKDFEVNGENGSKIFVAFNNDGNESNLTFVDYNTTIVSNEKAIISLDFNNSNINNFHYFIRLQDVVGHNSEYLHIDILKDDIAPSASQNTITKEVTEEQKLVLNVNVTDISDIKYYIINSQDDNNSVDYSLFYVNKFTGFVTFIDEPNYEDDKRDYVVVIRAEDEALNHTDVTLNISLTNLLDNPPELINTNYVKDIIETNINGTKVYDLNATLKAVSDAPDNIFPVEYRLNNHTDLFDLNITTGKLTIKDASDDFFDFEKNVPHSLDLNISVENNNSNSNGILENYQTYLNLKVNVQNKIDTTPKLNTPSDINISEHRTSPVYTFFTVDINETLSDKDPSMSFSILSGDDGQFNINHITGQITTTGDTLDFETKNKYNLVIRATNDFWNNDTNINYDDINIVININDVIDNAPSIDFTSQTNSIAESTNENITVATIDTNGTVYDQNQINSYSILTPNVPFKIDSSGVVSTSRQLLGDYNETINNNSTSIFSIQIVAQNKWWNNSLNNSNILVFNIELTNVIDNAPILKQPTSQTIDEDKTTWSYQIQPDGINFDTNQTTSFSILSGDDSKFTISNTGLIELNSTLDWETKKSYTISIDASNTWWDNSINKSDPIDLIININNIIEKPPKITGPSIINVHEHIDINEIIGQIAANSTQKDEQKIDTFSIVSPTDKFAVLQTPLYNDSNLPYTDLSMIAKIDYETNSSYTLDINATNSFGSSTHTIQINVIDDIEKNLPLLIVAVEYDDINMSVDDGVYTELIFGGTFTKLNDYFNRISKEKFRFKKANESSNNTNDGVVKIHLNKNHPTNPSALKTDLREALLETNSSVDYTIFDTKRVDGIISKDELQILFIVAGGEETYGDINQSIKASSGTFSNLIIDGVYVATDQGNDFDSHEDVYDKQDGNYAVVGELNNGNLLTIGLPAHHLAHTALSFPYLRDTTEASYGIGYFGLMGYGFKGHDINESSGTTPVNISAYNLISQGWIYPTTINKNTYDKKLISSNKGKNGFNILKINTNNPLEYYLIENRVLTDTIGYDIGFYGMENKTFNGGLALWKINEANINNRDVNNKLVDFVEHDQDDGLDNSKLHFGKSTSLYHQNDPTYSNVDVFSISNSSLDGNETNTMIIDIGGF